MAYRFIEHTADIAVEIVSESIEKLFSDACTAWNEAVLININPKFIDSKKFIFDAQTEEELLVELLSELNFQLFTKKWVFTAVNNILLEKQEDNFHLVIEIFGQPLNENDHEIKVEIKAVTFHQLKIEKRNNKYTTIIVFDI